MPTAKQSKIKAEGGHIPTILFLAKEAERTNLKEALYWYNKGARLDNVNSMYGIVRMSDRMREDLILKEQANFWRLAIAGLEGSLDAKFEAGKALVHGRFKATWMRCCLWGSGANRVRIPSAPTIMPTSGITKRQAKAVLMGKFTLASVIWRGLEPRRIMPKARFHSRPVFLPTQTLNKRPRDAGVVFSYWLRFLLLELNAASQRPRQTKLEP